MPRANLPFANGFYESDSLPVSAQSCINFYPVLEGAPSLQQETLRSIPGMYQVVDTGTSASDTNRGGYSFGGVPYFVNGTKLYRLESDHTLTDCGTIAGTDRVIMADNGTQLMILVPGGNGYIFTADPDTLTQITDTDFTTTNGAPQGLVYIDSYFVVTTDEKKFIISAVNDGESWNALDYGSAESSPDSIVSPVVFNNQLFVGGERTIEAFTNIGGTDFPFIRSGLFVDAGFSSVYSVVNAPNTFCWIGAGKNEVPSVWMMDGNQKRKISTRAIDAIIEGLTNAQLADVFSWSYSQLGNFFVGFHLPGTTTIVYDLSTEKWHERRSYYSGSATDGDPWRASCLVEGYGKIYVGDIYSHKIGVLDPDVADEMDASNTANEIYREFCTQPFQNNLQSLYVPYLELVVESGLGDAPGYDPGSYYECQDYSCSAMVARAQEAGYTAFDFGFLQESSPTVPAELDAWDGNPTGVELQADKVGDAMGSSSLEQYYLYALDGEIDACEGWDYALGLGENSGGLPQGAKLTAPAIDNYAGFSAATLGGFQSSNNGSGVIIRNAEWTCTRSGGSDESYDMDIGLGWDNAQGLRAWDFDQDYYFGDPTFESINFTTVTAYFTNPRNEQREDGAYRMVADYFLEVQINDTVYTGTRTWGMTPWESNGPWTWVGVEYGQIRMFSGMKAILFSMIMVQEDVDVDQLHSFYQQNFADYEQPAWCPGPRPS